MPPRSSVNVFVKEVLKGNFRNVCYDIISKKPPLETNEAIKIVISICNVCHENLASPEKINEGDLAKLAKLLLKFIHLPNDELFTIYGQSIFHIVKLLIEKKSFDCIIDLQNVIIPEFMPLILTEKHQNIYENISKSIYNVVVHFTQTKCKSYLENMVQLCYLLVEFHKKLNKKSYFLEIIHNCFLLLIKLEITPEEFSKFYQNVLNAIDRIEDLKLYPLLVKNLSTVYTNLLKCQNFKEANNCFQVTLRKFKLFKGRDFILLGEIIQVAEDLNPLKVSDASFNRAHSSLKTYHSDYNTTINLQAVCEFVSSVAFTVLQLFKKNNKWIVTIKSHSVLYKFLNDVALIMSKTPHRCPCNKCSTTTNIVESLRVLNSIGGLGKLTITTTEVTRIYKIDILRYLEKSLQYVTILKENNCNKWENFWYDICVHIYSIGIHFYNKKDTEMFTLYFERFIEAYIEFEKAEKKIIDTSYLLAVLNIMSESYHENQEYEKCLLLTALSISISETYKNEINRWIRAKSASRENTIEDNRELQEQTLVSVFENFERKAPNYLAKYRVNLSTKRKIELLIYELRQYSLKWKSKTPMASVFKQLSQIASSQLCAEVFIEIWGDGDLSVHENLPNLLKDVIKKLEEEDFPKKIFLLSHLYFLNHKYRIADNIVKKCDNIVNGTDPDGIDSYEVLNLSCYNRTMKELNNALDLSQEWVSKNLEEDFDKDQFFKLLINIGHEYCLHGNVVKTLEAWYLAVRVADQSDNSLQRLQAVSFILELSDVRKPLLQKLIHQVEKDLDFITNTEALIVYHLCKSEGFFYVDFDTAYKSFRQALECSKNFKGSLILQARIYLLHHKFIMLPCRYQVEGHKEYSLVKIHQATTTINMYYSESVSTSYDMCQFFNIYNNLIRMYHGMRLPREVRCYAKDALFIAQKMALPLRIPPLLFYLAHSDIMMYRFDDCRQKLKHLSGVLCLIENKHISVASSPRLENKDIEVLCGEMNEMMLDVPKLPKPVTLTKFPENFKLPEFLNHEVFCECFYCVCLEYQEFVMKKTYLSALLNEYEDNMSVAKEFFTGCTKIHECLKSKMKYYVDKTAKKIPVDLVPNVRDKLIEAYCLPLLEYGNVLIRRGSFQDAECLNKKVLNLLESFQLQFIYLYNEALVQKLNIVLGSQENEEEKNVLSVVKEQTALKTPPNQMNPVVDAKILPKNLRFELSDDEDEPEKKITLLKNNLKTPAANLKTPASLKTPSTKIKIYTSKSTTKKTTKKVLEVPEFKEPSTPSVVIKTETVDSTLAFRTRLLTERLKNSSRKVTDDKEKGVRNANVRQNLLSQLDDAEKEQGGVRRSARNRNK